MKKTDAQASIEVYCDCPYCEHYQDIFEKVKESLGFELSAYDVNIEITCEECKEQFIVTDIYY